MWAPRAGGGYYRCVPFVFVLDAGSVELARRRFTSLPIRIGRNALNDCPIVHPMVSNFHARIEDVGGKLCIEDLDSKNGVHLIPPGSDKPQRIPSHQPTDLEPGGFQFFLSVVLKITITFEKQQDALDDRLQQSFAASVLGNRSVLFGPGGAPGAAQRASFPPAAGPSHFSGPPNDPRAFAPTPPQSELNGPRTQHFGDLRPENLALQGLRELAQALVPGSSLDTTGDIARFITKVHDALDAFLRSAVPLREGYAQFIACFDLPHGQQRRSPHRSAASAAVEAATTPHALAQALLDPRDPSFDAPRALEGIFADLMFHQMAVLDGMMRGVRALLEQISPAAIEKEAGHGFPLGRYKANWETFVRRFDELYEERRTFSVVFGPEFAAAYRRYRQGG